MSNRYPRADDTWTWAVCPYCGNRFEPNTPICQQCRKGELCWADVDGPDSFPCQLPEGHDGDCRSPNDHLWEAVKDRFDR